MAIWHVNGYLKALALSYQKAAMKTEKPKKCKMNSISNLWHTF